MNLRPLPPCQRCHRIVPKPFGMHMMRWSGTILCDHCFRVVRRLPIYDRIAVLTRLNSGRFGWPSQVGMNLRYTPLRMIFE